jgi:RP/EB family microtubule-associated protein
LLTQPCRTDTFTKHQVDRTVPVEALIKCKMQDNLEFLQWTKRFWDQYYPGGEYDAVGRRKGGALPAGGGAAPRAASGAARRPGGTTPTTGPRAPARAAGGGPATAALQQENNTLKETVVGLERERDFYFSKLRDIELLVQQAVDEDPELEKPEDGLVKQIQTILYSTEEGFEIPESEQVDDQETF